MQRRRDRGRVDQRGVGSKAAPRGEGDDVQREFCFRRRGSFQALDLRFQQVDVVMRRYVQAERRQPEPGVKDELGRFGIDVDVPLTDGVIARGVERRAAVEAERAADDDQLLHFLGQIGILHQCQRDVGQRPGGDQRDVTRVAVDRFYDDVRRVGDAGGQVRLRQVGISKPVRAMRERVGWESADQRLQRSLPHRDRVRAQQRQHLQHVAVAAIRRQVAGDGGDGLNRQSPGLDGENESQRIVDSGIEGDQHSLHEQPSWVGAGQSSGIGTESLVKPIRMP